MKICRFERIDQLSASSPARINFCALTISHTLNGIIVALHRLKSTLQNNRKILNEPSFSKVKRENLGWGIVWQLMIACSDISSPTSWSAASLYSSRPDKYRGAADRLMWGEISEQAVTSCNTTARLKFSLHSHHRTRTCILKFLSETAHSAVELNDLVRINVPELIYMNLPPYRNIKNPTASRNHMAVCSGFLWHDP